jgi:hypothetical protein
MDVEKEVVIRPLHVGRKVHFVDDIASIFIKISAVGAACDVLILA